MKKMYLVVAATLIAAASFSQVRFGAQLIGNAGSISTNSDDLQNFKSKTNIGVGGGLVADIGLSEKFSIRPSLNFIQKRGSVEYQSEDVTGKKTTINSTLNFVELPLQFVLKFPMKNMTAYVGAGPSFGYGVSGKLKVNGWIYEDTEGDEIGDPIEINEKVDAFKKEDKGGAELKRFDISANAVAGVEFKSGLYANAGYALGLSNLAKDTNQDKYKTRGIQLTVGFFLPAKL